MNMEEILESELAKLRLTRPELQIVEVGSIRTDSEQAKESDGWSTVTFARHERAYGGEFISIDLDVSTAKEVMKSYGLDGMVTFKKGMGADELAKLLRSQRYFDLILLDGGGDPDVNLSEFIIAMSLVTAGGTVIVDDASEDSEAGACKAHSIIPYLRETGTPYEIIDRTSSTYTTGMLIVRGSSVG